MALYVYGVVRAGTPVPVDDRGLGPVETLTDGDLVAVCSRVDDEPLGRRRELRAHADVLGELAHESPVIPFVFGTVLPDERTVRADVLRDRADHLLAELDRLADVVQMTVRLVPDEQRLLTDLMASSPQLRELERQVNSRPGPANQAQQVRLGEAVAHQYRDWVHRLSTGALEALGKHAREVRVESDGGAGDQAQGAFLVARAQVPEFLRAAGEVADGMSGRMVCRITGPLAPYSFVSPVHTARSEGVRS